MLSSLFSTDGSIYNPYWCSFLLTSLCQSPLDTVGLYKGVPFKQPSRWLWVFYRLYQGSFTLQNDRKPQTQILLLSLCYSQGYRSQSGKSVMLQSLVQPLRIILLLVCVYLIHYYLWSMSSDMYNLQCHCRHRQVYSCQAHMNDLGWGQNFAFFYLIFSA